MIIKTILKRIKIIENIGLSFSPKYNSYIGNNPIGANIGVIEIQTMTNDEFNNVIIELKEAQK